MAGESVDVAGPRDIAEYAIGSKLAHRAFVKQLFQHITKQNPAAYGLDTIDKLAVGFANDQFNMQNLLVEIAVVATQPVTVQTN